MIERLHRKTAFTSTSLVALLLVSLLRAQGTPPATPLAIISPDGRRTVSTTMLNGQEMVSLDEIVMLFQVTVREDNLAGGLTIGYRGRTIVVSSDQPLASVSGRVVALPSAAVRVGGRWFVPVEFIQRALAPIYDRRIDLRRSSRLLVVGDVRVPRVVARVDTAGPPSHATIEIAPAAAVSADVSDTRVLLRVEADALDLTLPQGGAGLIEQVRTGDQQNSVAVVLNSTAGTARVASSTADNITRVTVEVPTRSSSPSEPATPPRPDAASDVLSPVSQRAFQTIVVDPGHGGDDVGARGSAGTQEKQITLEVARRLKTLVESRLGLRVLLTREDDHSVRLDDRAALANNSKADLFLSLHVSAALSTSVTGVEVFFVRLDSEGEQARRDLNSQSVSLPVLGGGTREIEVIRWDFAQAGHVDESGVLAGMLEETLRERAEMSPRPIQQAQLRVLTAVNMPAALVEMGYVTNPTQEKLIASNEYQISIAQALYETIVRFRAHVEGQRSR